MKKLHIKKQSFEGYCIGTGVEYPGIIVHGKSSQELQKKFVKALPGHIQALQNRAVKNQGVEVLEIDRPEMD